ncbi:MAG TPA: hypothetical protein VMU89_04380 [Thermomicrobiaceae bacterium]|nr:hypothetical protein [Thermomicrobiaceae bacterium]
MEYRSPLPDEQIGNRVSRRGFLRLAAGTLGVASAAVLVACGGRRTAGGQDAIIQITPDNKLEPASVSIVQAASVVWTNVSKDTHAISVRPVSGQTMPAPMALNPVPGATPQPQSADSGDIPSGGSWSYTFFVPGDYRYSDTKDQSLSGTITVIA